MAADLKSPRCELCRQALRFHPHRRHYRHQRDASEPDVAFTCHFSRENAAATG